MNDQQTIQEAFNALNLIETTSSTKDKQAILDSYKTNSVLVALMLLAYNPFWQYGIKKIPVTPEMCVHGDMETSQYSGFMLLLDKLKNRELTGNAAIEALTQLLVKCSDQEYKWYTRALTKDLRIGMATTGINKVLKGAIPTYEVMLADKVNPEDLNLDTPKALKLLPDNIITQYKIDGYRLNIHVLNNGDTLIRTRNGKVVSGYNQLEKEASELLPKGYVYDGEIVAPELFDWINTNNTNNQSTTPNREFFTEAMSHAFSKEDNKQGIFNLFDMVPEEEWQTKNTTEPYKDRLARIDKLIKPLNLTQIVVVPSSKVYNKTNQSDLQEIVAQFHEFLNVGWEGLMVKDANALYQFKRTKSLLKMKLMDTLDLTVVDVFEGTGKYQNMLGGVYVDYKGYRVGVGSGWSDEQRLTLWKDKNLILGKTLEISYQAETQNKQGGLSLSFPVVKQIRNDK